MKHIYFLFFSAFLFLVSACSTVPLPAKENQFENKVFVHLFFDSEEECMAAQPDPEFFLNCHQQLDFFEDNEVHVMLTDIIHIGTYEVSGEYLIIDIKNNSEIPGGEIIFEIINSAQLVKVDDQTVWKRLSGDSLWE